jgi:penicillin amidase
MRTVLAAALVLALVLAVAAGLRALRARGSARAAFPTAAGSIAIDGIAARVEIFRDPAGVPHVVAESEADALAGLGFAHAQDRLAQMLWLRNLARGRGAEVVGAAGLPADRIARTLGLARLADAEYRRTDAATRRALEAYAGGVNARIERVRTGQVGAPLALLRARLPIEDWRPADSLALLKLYAWGLAGPLDRGLVLEDLIESLGGAGARVFFPPGRGEGLPPAPSPPAPGVETAVGRAEAPEGGDALQRAAGLSGRTVGSTAWVVGGGASRSGRPLLAADAHYEPTAPPLLHLDHLRGGDLDVAGVTLPGVPVVWTGANRRVAWASTHGGVATTDLFHETLHASDPALYHDGNGWRALEVREETLHVRGGPDEILRVRSTRHGPLVHEILDAVRDPLSLAWSGARIGEGTSVGAWLAVARARDARELRDALARHREPVLAVVYADAEGEVGLQIAGWIPRRVLASGLVPVPGRAPWYDWRERIPFSELPREGLADARGWLVAADNRFAGSEGAGPIEWLWRSGERARRVDSLLRAALRSGPLDVRSVASLQADVGSERAAETVALALALAGDLESLGDEAREIVGLLRAWDARESFDSVGAAAYHLLLGRLTDELIGRHLEPPLLRRYLALPQADPGGIVLGILRAAAEGEGGGWSDAQQVSSAVRASLRGAWHGLAYRLGANRAKWTWGRLHPLRFRPLAPAPREGSALASLGPFAYGGSDDTLAAAAYDAADPFAVRVAAVCRFAVDTATPDELLVALAPGQSEHPGHPHYRDGLAGWLEGRARLLVTSPLVFEEFSPERLLLEPRS